MNEAITEKSTLDELVESLERHEAERTLESLRSGSPFDAGIVEGISGAIDQLDSARTSGDLQNVLQNLTSLSSSIQQQTEDDAYAKGIAAGVSHVAGIVQEELESTPVREI